MDRTELGRFLFRAQHLGGERAELAVLLGLNGLRVSESCETDIGDLGFDRGHRTLWIVGKGSKPAVIQRVPRTSRSADLAIGERREGPILLRHDGQRLDRRTAHRRVKAIGKRAGLGHVHPHMLGGASSWRFSAVARLSLRDVQLAARHGAKMSPASSHLRHERPERKFSKHSQPNPR